MRSLGCVVGRVLDTSTKKLRTINSGVEMMKMWQQAASYQRADRAAWIAGNTVE
jgi:hypothetical protein